jgi:hypothetical protein
LGSRIFFLAPGNFKPFRVFTRDTSLADGRIAIVLDCYGRLMDESIIRFADSGIPNYTLFILCNITSG